MYIEAVSLGKIIFLVGWLQYDPKEENVMFRLYHIAVVLLILAVLLLGACSAKKSEGLTPGQVTLAVNLIEVKGATDGIPPPDVNPKDLSKGYRFKPPGEYDSNNPNKWQVSSYFYSPSSMSVIQGDLVTLKFFVINGDKHTSWIEAPDGSIVEPKTLMNRGREYDFVFTAEQPGHYILHCDEHEKTMRADILSIPSS